MSIGVFFSFPVSWFDRFLSVFLLISAFVCFFLPFFLFIFKFMISLINDIFKSVNLLKNSQTILIFLSIFKNHKNV